MKYATANKRFCAFFVDLLVLLGFNLLMGLVLGISAIASQVLALPLLGLWFFGGLLIATWLYNACFESSRWRATIGKRLLQLQVVTLDGKKIGFWRATARHFGKFLSRLIGFLGFFLIFFTEKKQALHDKIASTVVVQK